MTVTIPVQQVMVVNKTTRDQKGTIKNRFCPAIKVCVRDLHYRAFIKQKNLCQILCFSSHLYTAPITNTCINNKLNIMHMRIGFNIKRNNTPNRGTRGSKPAGKKRGKKNQRPGKSKRNGSGK